MANWDELSVLSQADLIAYDQLMCYLEGGGKQKTTPSEPARQPRPNPAKRVQRTQPARR